MNSGEQHALREQTAKGSLCSAGAESKSKPALKLPSIIKMTPSMSAARTSCRKEIKGLQLGKGDGGGTANP